METCKSCPMEVHDIENTKVLVFVCKICGTIARYGNGKRIIIKTDGIPLEDILTNDE